MIDGMKTIFVAVLLFFTAVRYLAYVAKDNLFFIAGNYIAGT